MNPETAHLTESVVVEEFLVTKSLTCESCHCDAKITMPIEEIGGAALFSAQENHSRVVQAFEGMGWKSVTLDPSHYLVAGLPSNTLVLCPGCYDGDI